VMVVLEPVSESLEVVLFPHPEMKESQIRPAQKIASPGLTLILFTMNMPPMGD
jgi:hypothetical protein